MKVIQGRTTSGTPYAVQIHHSAQTLRERESWCVLALRFEAKGIIRQDAAIHCETEAEACNAAAALVGDYEGRP